MQKIWTVEDIRSEMARLDGITGLHGAELPIRLGNAARTLGQFYACGGKASGFRFSRKYVEDPEFPVEETLDLIRHEYAHYMDLELYGNLGHGATWKKCCLDIGARPERLHNRERENMLRDRHRVEDRLESLKSEYAAGRVISHPRYGPGTIEEVCGEGAGMVVRVSFERYGVKRLALKWVIDNCE